MNAVILTAGGIGSRMNNNIPKQFLTVDNKPIILYTLEAFQNHPNIDMIVVSCLAGWEQILQAYAIQYGITKLKFIVKGGKTGQESITNALNKLKDVCLDDDLVMVHDGNRPLVSDMIISDSLAVCLSKGNAVAQIPCTEALITTEDQHTSKDLLNRDLVKRTQTPHTFRFGELYDGYQEMIRRGETEVVAPCAVMMKLGKQINFSNGSEENFKITTSTDLKIFEALVNYETNTKVLKKQRTLY